MIRYFLSLILLLCSCIEIPTIDDFILRPNTAISTLPSDLGYDYDEIVLTVATGRNVILWHVKAENPRALFVVFPGSDANKSLYCEALPLFVPEGLDVLMMDYEGFGNSPGTKSLQHCADDTIAVARYATTLNPKVILYGVSLGTPSVARAAAELNFTGCIFEGTVILKQEAGLWLRDNSEWYNPISALIGNTYMSLVEPREFDILSYIPQVKEPKLFMHSIEDDITPYTGGLKVFNAANEPKEFWEMIGGHGQMVRIDTETYKTKVIGWINQVLAQ